MPSHAVILHPPRDEQVFEDLCLDLFQVLWGGAQLYGRRGHGQKGIDLYGRLDGAHVAVQCKKREGKLTRGDMKKDVEKARALDPPLARLTFATTAKRDPGLQDFVRQLNDGGEVFQVEIWFWDDLEREISRHDDVYRFWEPCLGAAPPLVSVGRLPSTLLPRLMGRDAELAFLDEAWAHREIRVFSLVAVGGAGKTALVHHWMQGFEQTGWKAKGAAAAFAWSFYSQGGGEDRQASGDAFIDAALRFFGDQAPSGTDQPLSAWARGLRLANLVRRRRTLLILDGLEPLQEPPASAQAGKVKDPAVAALIRALAADNPGLLVITSREPVADLASRDLWGRWKQRWFGRPQRPERQILSLLGLFDRPAAAQALRALRRQPAIPGLTDRLVDLATLRWNLALERLRQARLLLAADGGAGGGGRKAPAADADLPAWALPHTAWASRSRS